MGLLHAPSWRFTPLDSQKQKTPPKGASDFYMLKSKKKAPSHARTGSPNINRWGSLDHKAPPTPMAGRPLAYHSKDGPSRSMLEAASPASCLRRGAYRALPCPGPPEGKRTLNGRREPGRDGGPGEDGAQPMTGSDRTGAWIRIRV